MDMLKIAKEMDRLAVKVPEDDRIRRFLSDFNLKVDESGVANLKGNTVSFKVYHEYGGSYIPKILETCKKIAKKHGLVVSSIKIPTSNKKMSEVGSNDVIEFYDKNPVTFELREG